MQIPILSGITSDSSPDFRTSYPRNMVPVPKSQGVSEGYLRPADGIVQFAAAVAGKLDRGGITWRGKHYRVQGTRLYRFDADASRHDLGDVGPGGWCTFDYGFDCLAINSGKQLWYWDESMLTRVDDPDLGPVLSVVWVAGYFMTTDGTSLVVTELTDRTKVNPLKYGSSEADPDPVKALLKVINEVYALNRHTIEVFDNIGGTGFPFRRIDGAQVQRGVIGSHACCVFPVESGSSIAFLGSGRNEAPSVYLMTPGGSTPIATREIDQLLKTYTEAELALVVLEARVDKAHQHLLVHLPDRTLVYDGAATRKLQQAVWFTQDSGVLTPRTYQARGLVWCYDKWLAGDPTSSRIGQLVDTISSHYGAVVGWEFGTVAVYNESRGAIFTELELVALTGRVALGADPTIWTSYSLDGMKWSQERPIKAGKVGDTLKRLAWRKQGKMRSIRMQRFRGTSDAHIAFARLEAELEPLYG